MPRSVQQAEAIKNLSSIAANGPSRSEDHELGGAGPADAVSRKLRLLIVGINYSPEPSGIGPYTAGLANHYAESGHFVRVVTGLVHYPQWRPIKMREEAINGTNPAISRHWHFVPTGPSVVGRALYEGTWFASACGSLIRQHADVVIGVIPSLSGGALALMAGLRSRAPVGLIFQDLIGPAALQSGYGAGGRVASVARVLESFLARRAAGIAIVSEGFRPYLERAGVDPSRIVRVRNWSNWCEPSESAAETRRRLGWDPSEFVCLHAGNMGRKQSLDNVLAAAPLLNDRGLRIVFAGDGNDRRRLMAAAVRLGLHNVSFLPVQAPRQFEAMLCAADVLLLNQRPSVADMSLPSKLASYLLSGRPVIGAVARGSDAATEISKAGAGMLVDPDNPGALASAVLTLQRSPIMRLELGRQGETYARDHLSARRALQGYDQFLERLDARVTA